MKKKKKSVVFMGGKQVGLDCLRYLVDNRDRLAIEIVAVLTSPRGKEIEELAGEHNLCFLPDLDEYLSIDDFDILISVQYHRILKATHIGKARKVAINLHMAPLPEYRGCNQFSYAIINGDAEFGTTIHQLEVGVDSGDIIAELRFPIPERCWVTDLFDLTCRKSIELFNKEIKRIIDGDYDLVSQKLLISERGTSFHLRKEIDDLKKIDLSWEGSLIERHIRGTYMEGFEPPYTIIDGKKVTFNVVKTFEKN